MVAAEAVAAAQAAEAGEAMVVAEAAAAAGEAMVVAEAAAAAAAAVAVEETVAEEAGLKASVMAVPPRLAMAGLAADTRVSRQRSSRDTRRPATRCELAC